MQVYKIFIYDFFTGEKIDWLVRAYNIKYSIKLNNVSTMDFSMDIQDEQTNDLNLKPFNIVKLARYFEDTNDYKTLFSGVIRNRKADDKTMQLQCISMLGFLEHRLTEPIYNISNANAGSEIFYLLNYTNGQGYTPITAGNNSCTDTITDMKFKYSKISTAIFKIIKQTSFDIWIDNDTHKLEVGTRGSDKSSTVSFQRDANKLEQTNIQSFNILDDSALLASKVVGRSSSIYSNSYFVSEKVSPIANYPLLEKSVSFSEAVSQLQVDAQTQQYLDTHNEIISIPRVIPLNDREIFSNYWVGDYIKIKLVQNNYLLEKVQRLIAINVSVGYNNDETINIETSSGEDKRQDIFDVMANYEKRLSNLENI